MLMSLLWKLASSLGGVTFDKLLGGVADFLQKRANDDLVRFQTGVAADTQIALAQVNAQIEVRKEQAKLIQADRGWGIAKLPPPYDGYEQAIILSFFIARPFEKVARVFAAGRG